MGNQITIIGMRGHKGDYLKMHRVSYGKKDTPRDKREYKMFPSSPVGCVNEILDFAKGRGMKIEGLVLVDTI